MAPPCTCSRCFNRDKQGVSNEQSRRRLVGPIGDGRVVVVLVGQVVVLMAAVQTPAAFFPVRERNAAEETRNPQRGSAAEGGERNAPLPCHTTCLFTMPLFVDHATQHVCSPCTHFPTETMYGTRLASASFCRNLEQAAASLGDGGPSVSDRGHS